MNELGSFREVGQSKSIRKSAFQKRKGYALNKIFKTAILGNMLITNLLQAAFLRKKYPKQLKKCRFGSQMIQFSGIFQIFFLIKKL